MKKNFIIKSPDDFNLIINSGKKIKGEILTIYYYPSSDKKNYFGFAIGKKNGNAVERNKIKRKIRMLVHNNQLLFKKSFKYIIMLRKDCLLFSYEKWEKDMISILGKVENNEEN